jgi:hypothetical protein
LADESGVPLSWWSGAELATEVVTRGVAEAISACTVRRWLSADAIKPWQHRSWIFPRDPHFEVKAARVLDLCARQWQGQPLGDDDYVISADEKSQLQALRRRHPGQPPAFRFKDMVGLGRILLGETLGVEMVLGQVSRPWKAVAASTKAPTTPEQFTSFDEPGFAKIAASLRIDPYGNDSSILTLETRVAITDDKSRRRFRRYWLLIGPFSSLIRRMALRLLATELRRSAPGRPNNGGVGS